MIVRPGQLALLTFALLVALGRGALGEEAATPPSLRLVLRSEGPGILEAQSLRGMLEAELGRRVFLDGDAAPAADGGTLTITTHAAGNELTVSYLPPAGEPVTRTVSAPQAREEVAPLAVLLAGNLARDQTTELLDVPARRPERIAEGAATATAVEAHAGTPPDAGLSARLVALGKRAHPLVWAESLSVLNVGAELAGRTFYAQLGAAYHPDDGYGRALVGPTAAVGARFPLRKLPFSVESDIGFIYFRGLGSADVAPPASYVSSGAPDAVVYTATRLISRLRVALVYNVRPRLDLFAGAALALTTHFYEVPSNDFGPELFGGIRL
jgi:hypothetical protein